MTETRTYRKKPVEIEAQQWMPVEIEAQQWMPDDLAAVGRVVAWMGTDDSYMTRDGRLVIRTLGGTMTADAGDWIIRGAQGGFYPCKPDIFAATYEAVAP